MMLLHRRSDVHDELWWPHWHIWRFCRSISSGYMQ